MKQNEINNFFFLLQNLPWNYLNQSEFIVCAIFDEDLFWFDENEWAAHNFLPSTKKKKEKELSEIEHAVWVHFATER